MKKSYFLSAVLLPAWISHFANAQPSIQNQGAEVNIPTSQTYDFIKYGTLDAFLYTGTINYSLPVYTYKDKDFEIPISFDYASNGFQPNMRAGELGLGWMLNAGGCITREIKGIPDEETENIDYTRVAINGFLHLNRSSFGDMESLPKSVQDISGNIFLYRKDLSTSKNYETSPDIFHFNFMGYSGYFYVWYHGEIKVYCSNPHQNIKVEISHNGDRIQHMTLTTQNGYKYQFGGGTTEKEYTTFKNNNGVEKYRDYTWKLYSITAPNNRSVYFKYQNPAGYSGITYNYQPYSTYVSNIFTSGTTSQSSMKNIRSTGMYSSPLTKIEISDGSVIDISYILSAGELKAVYNSGGGTLSAFQTPKIKNIKVINGADTLARCHITYKLSNPDISANPRLKNTVYFLGSVNIKGEGTYSFDYNNLSDKGFPALGSFSIDHWGYYNGKNDLAAPLNFIDYLSYSKDNTETINTDIRNPDSMYSMMGMLRQINYPPGGYSMIEYEPHDYTNHVIRDLRHQFLPELMPVESTLPIAGGVRIKKVETRNADNQIIDSKTYSYTNASGLSSGTLLNMPRYGIEYQASGIWGIKAAKYCSLYDLYNYNKTHIEYSRVVQTNKDESKTIYSYTDYNEYPDLQTFSIHMSSEMRVPTILFYNDGSYQTDYYLIAPEYAGLIRNILTPMSSMQNKRGKLKQTEIRTKEGSLIRVSSNQYAELKDFTVNSHNVVGEDYRITGSKYFCFWPASTTTIINSNNGNISANTTYHYNTSGQIASTIVTNSKGDQEITRYTYATKHPTPGNIYNTMISRNLLNYPISMETCYKPAGENEIQTGYTSYTYALFNNIVKLHKIHISDKTSKRLLVQKICNSYDTKGNLTQSTDANGIPTSYIWGYNGLYLVAKGENISYTDLSAQVGVSSTLPAGVTVPHATVAANCPNARIEFYEYKPLVGLSKHTDPSGKVLTYSYNASGKLKAITDEKGKLHKEYLYSPDNKQ